MLVPPTGSVRLNRPSAPLVVEYLRFDWVEVSGSMVSVIAAPAYGCQAPSTCTCSVPEKVTGVPAGTEAGTGSVTILLGRSRRATSPIVEPSAEAASTSRSRADRGFGPALNAAAA